MANNNSFNRAAIDSVRYYVLFNAKQKAFHVETAIEYNNRPQNGYRICRICDTHAESEKALKQLMHVFTSERRWEQ